MMRCKLRFPIKPTYSSSGFESANCGCLHSIKIGATNYANEADGPLDVKSNLKSSQNARCLIHIWFFLAAFSFLEGDYMTVPSLQSFDFLLLKRAWFSEAKCLKQILLLDTVECLTQIYEVGIKTPISTHPSIHFLGTFLLMMRCKCDFLSEAT